MPEKFKAVVIDNQNEKFTREIKELDNSDLKDGNVLVKIDYSSLNYKDAFTAAANFFAASFEDIFELKCSVTTSVIAPD